jgi:phage terminase Nu1 subunit (DNA packaging protein)
LATQAECARRIDVSERRFRELVDEGVIDRADKANYDADAVVIRYIRHLREVAAGRGGGESQAIKADEDARLARARADKAEMELAEARGQLIPADQIGDAVNSAVQIMRTRVLAIPTKAAPLVGAKDIPAAEKVIRDQVFEALSELSKVSVVAGSQR